MRPRVPSISCRSMARSRSFSSEDAFEQLVALDDDRAHRIHSRESGRVTSSIGLVFRGVGAEQLAERIVDLQPAKADRGQRAKHREDNGASTPVRDREKADPLDAERKIARLDDARLRFAEFRGGAGSTN